MPNLTQGEDNLKQQLQVYICGTFWIVEVYQEFSFPLLDISRIHQLSIPKILK